MSTGAWRAFYNGSEDRQTYYNIFRDTMETMDALRLWNTDIRERDLYLMWMRVKRPVSHKLQNSI